MEATNNLKLNLDVKQILNVLSSSLYKGDVLAVATRELLQNAFDAVKGVENPKIEFNWDSCCRVLTVRDNGVGMNPETVRNVFFTVGGTLKEGLDVSERSGGFGIAKVQFFMAASKVYVRSCKDGVVTVAKATQTQLLEGTGFFEVSDASNYANAFDNFTEVELTFPSTYTDATGAVKNVSYRTWSITDVLEKPLVGYENIMIMYQNSLYSSNKSGYTNTFCKSYSWGDLEIFFTPETRGSYLEADVHCAGLYQFHCDKYYGNDEGLHCIFNIKPKHAAGSQYYPFANSRDDFSGIVKQDLEEIHKLLHELTKAIKSEKVQQAYSSQQLLDYMDTDGVVVREAVGKSNRVPINWQKQLDGKSLDELLDVLGAIAREVAEYAKKTEEAHAEGKQTLLRLINKTNKDLSMHKEVFSKIASVVYDAIYHPEIRKQFKQVPTIAGIVVEDNIGGCFLTMDGIHGVYLNPLGEYRNGTHFAHAMMDVLIHEFAHSHESCHCDRFFGKERIFMNILFENYLYLEIFSKFETIYLQHGELLNK